MAAIHSATSDELEYLRANGRFVRFALAFPQSNTVWEGRINQADFNLAYVSELTWDAETGDYADIAPGMTLWIGSAAGLYDVGIIRIRKVASSTKVFFDPVSKISFADNLYLTVVDDFPIKSKQFAYDADGVPYANTDTAYTDQNTNCKPIVIMGGDAVVYLTAGAGSLLRDLSDSWVPGSTITDYLCECATADSVDDSTTDHPTINFDVAGTHLIKVTITADNGEESVRYQKVLVWDDDNLPAFCKVETMPYFGFTDGGGECAVRCFSGVGLDLVKPNAKVILFDYQSIFDGDAVSMGQSVGSENVAFSGYIIGESIQTDEATGDVLFTIRGVQDGLKRARGNGFQVTRTIVDPERWDEILNPTADLLYWHFITWQTTLSDCIDCYPPNLDTIYPGWEGSKGTIFEQLYSLGEKNFIVPGCDAWGRLFFEVDADMLSDDDKGDVIEVMTITTADRASARIDKLDSGLTSAVYGSSISIQPTQTLPRTLYSVAPGLVEGDEGNSIINDYYAPSQAESNSLAGRLYANKNNNETVTVILPQNNRLIGVFPRQVLIVTIADDENPRGEYTGPMVPRNIRYNYDEAGGVVNMEIQGRYLQPEGLSANGVIPITDGVGGYEEFNIPTDTPDFPADLVLLPELPELPAFPGDTETVEPETALTMVADGEMWYTQELSGLDPSWWLMDPDQQLLGQLRNFAVTPDGHIYLIYKRQVWWATIDNPHFTLVFSPAFLEAEYPGGFEPFQQVIAAYGVSPVDPNKLLLLMGSGHTGSRVGHFWMGDQSGVTRHASVETGWYPQSYDGVIGDISLGDGKWLVSYASHENDYSISIFSLDGNTLLDFVEPAVLRHVRAASSNTVLGWTAAFTPALSLDNGLTWSTITFEDVDHYLWPQSLDNWLMAISPSGNRILACGRGPGSTQVLMASDDQGANWDYLTLPAGFEPTCVWNVDEDRWYIAGREALAPPIYPPLVYYTDDFGVTWYPKYGNFPIQKTNVVAGIRKIVIR